MATSESITGRTGTGNSPLSKDINAAIYPAFAVSALLQGASALLDEAQGLDDSAGNIWAAREIIDAAWIKVRDIYMEADNMKLRQRAEELEAMAAFECPADGHSNVDAAHL